MSKYFRNNKGEHFNFALGVVFFSIFISILAFMSEDKGKITGFVTSDYNSEESSSSYSADVMPVLAKFGNLNDLRSLAKGNYYIDSDGIVYWIDDDSKPAVGKVTYIRDTLRNRLIYIDDNGNIGYIIT